MGRCGSGGRLGGADGAVRRGELILVDAGVEVDSLYTADVTRTIPVDGRFTEAQRRIYQAVLDAADPDVDRPLLAELSRAGMRAVLIASPDDEARARVMSKVERIIRAEADLSTLAADHTASLGEATPAALVDGWQVAFQGGAVLMGAGLVLASTGPRYLRPALMQATPAFVALVLYLFA